ncbi:alpha/beta hydrolase [Paenibacillus validus]|uniref:Alpha/beta fold hydrolase n=1 Tax=Paenibacillus validus TaxID=44253 RepID=A0A7X2Z8I7_9BACL|nr:alpha/beta hydrolase [Paenibacillus validus]MED4601048.1 alpha/beta hydrolase [Paenibacillus validus]MED4607481.1 alpha/beta hydrolase [Paenibacillus validus]MUG70264.1 alpha/beta fold hydrolase [Paenibacillus validus]
MSVPAIYKSEEGKKKILNDYESYLKRFHVEFERVFVDTRFGRTHTLVTGPVDGKPVFIFQGGNCINPMTLSWFSSLFGEYRIYAPDTIGHPGYSAETRMSAKDDSFALWVSDLMEHFGVDKSAFIGPSYGAGIILRIAAFLPEKIACSVLVAPSGLKLGSKMKMIQKILIPMIGFTISSSQKQLQKIADTMSFNSMKEIDKNIIGDIFTHVKLEQDMPKITEKRELVNYSSPTMVLAGTKDIFFPSEKVIAAAEAIIPNLAAATVYEMGHFPSEPFLQKINSDIKQFLTVYY